MLLLNSVSGRVRQQWARRRRQFSRSLGASLIALLATLSASTAAAQQAAPKPTLVVFFTIDQMRPDYLARFDKQLTGGLARLYRKGAVFENAYQDHAITETAPATRRPSPAGSPGVRASQRTSRAWKTIAPCC